MNDTSTMRRTGRSHWLEAVEGHIGEPVILFLFLAPALAILLLSQFYPLAYSAWISLVDWTLARSPEPGPFVGLENYRQVLSDRLLIESASATIILAVSSTALQMIFGLALALLTVGENYSLRLSRTFLLLPLVIAPIAVGTIWRMMLSARIGVVNQMLGAVGIDGPDWLGDPQLALLSLIIIDAWEWTPFVMIIYLAALTSLPHDLVRAASVDGASRLQIFTRLVWPLLLPLTLIIAMFRLIDSLLTLDIVFTTTGGGPGFATQTLSFWIYQQGLRYFNLSYAAAASWLLLVGCLLVAAGFLWWRRHIARWRTA